jgi:hypothetical protein
MFRYALYDASQGALAPGDLEIMLAAATAWSATLAAAWDLDPPEGECTTDPAEAACEVLFTFQPDDAAAPGALGFHDEQGARASAEVLTTPVLSNGGGVFDGGSAGVSVLSVLLHELGETLIDPACDKWVLSPSRGVFVAQEVCDPVQSVPYPVLLPSGAGALGSDAVLPAYFDEQAEGEPLSLTNALAAPLSIAPGGYQLVFDPAQLNGPDGPISSVFGEAMPAWLRAVKLRARSRHGARHGARARAGAFRALERSMPYRHDGRL